MPLTRGYLYVSEVTHYPECPLSLRQGTIGLPIPPKRGDFTLSNQTKSKTFRSITDNSEEEHITTSLKVARQSKHVDCEILQEKCEILQVTIGHFVPNFASETDATDRNAESFPHGGTSV